MGDYVGVDWASRRWIVVHITNDSVKVGAQPSIQAIWDQYDDADQILIDIPIGLPYRPELTPRPCDEKARQFVSASRNSTVFDVPCREAVRTSEHETALTKNVKHLDDDTLGPQKWGLADRIHEADVFMRRTDTDEIVRESHPEVCFTALTPDDSMESSKNTDLGQRDRLEMLEVLDPRLFEAFCEERARIEAKPAWKRRIGKNMLDDIIDAMVLAFTAMKGSANEFTVLGGERDEVDLPMEIVYYDRSGE